MSKDTWELKSAYMYPLQQWKSTPHGDEQLEITHGKVGNGWRTHEHLRAFSPSVQLYTVCNWDNDSTRERGD